MLVTADIHCSTRIRGEKLRDMLLHKINTEGKFGDYAVYNDQHFNFRSPKGMRCGVCVWLCVCCVYIIPVFISICLEFVFLFRFILLVFSVLCFGCPSIRQSRVGPPQFDPRLLVRIPIPSPSQYCIRTSRRVNQPAIKHSSNIDFTHTIESPNYMLTIMLIHTQYDTAISPVQ